jgi:S-adenosylmethionine hydrolase
VTVIDLTHQVPPFDVRAGSHALTRSVPHLGHGVVLAVVDPGVGSGRRGVCLRSGVGSAPQFFVGPDNGLLIAAAELVGGGSIGRVVELERPAAGGAATFDGRDVFAPAAAALCRGVPLEELGALIDPATLVRLPASASAIERGRLADGRHTLRTEITWVDHFGNLQLAARLADAGAAAAAGAAGAGDGAETGSPFPGRLTVELSPAASISSDTPRPLRFVETFADLASAELGLLEDSNGHLAVVANQASAARVLNVSAGEIVLLTW